MHIAIVRAVTRNDYQGYWAAQRFWPSGTATLVEIVNQDDDPLLSKPDTDPATGEAKPGHGKDPKKIGLKSLHMIQSEKHMLTVELREADDLGAIKLDKETGLPVSMKVHEEVAAERAKTEAALAEIAALKAALEEATAPPATKKAK